MGVIDFHSHILPGIDDGSRNDVWRTVAPLLTLVELHGVLVCVPHAAHV